ncbi:MAG: cytochrome C oxidase subunit IV family protein [Candidatus Binatia bacterium]
MNLEPVISVRTYVLVFVGLLALTATTTAVAFIDLGADWNSALAVGIAVVKALLVILFFMHVLYSRPLTWIFVGAGFFWLAILFALTLADYATRDDVGAGPFAGVPASSQAEQGRGAEIMPRVAR